MSDGMMNKSLLIAAIVSILVSFGVRLYVQSKLPPAPVLFDAKFYDLAARGMLEKHAYIHRGALTSLRPPGYPFFLAVMYAVTGEDVQQARVIQTVMVLLSSILLYLIARRTGYEKTAWVSLILYAWFPSLLVHSGFLMSENLFIPMSFVGILLLTKAVTSLRWSAAAGFWLGLCALTRSATTLFILASSMYIARKYHLRKGLTVLLCAAAVILPWTIRNAQVHHAFVLIDTVFSRVIEHETYDFVENRNDRKLMMEDKNIFQSTGDTEGVEIREHHERLKKIKTYLWHHPFLYMRQVGIHAVNFWGRSTRFFRMSHLQGLERFFQVLRRINVFLYVIFISLGIAGLTWSKRSVTKDFILIFIFVFSAVHFLAHGLPRYHLPLLPFVFLFVPQGWYAFRSGRYRAGYRSKWRFAGIACLLLFWILSGLAIFKVVEIV